MSKQYQSPANVCCCGRNEHNYESFSRYISSRDSSPEEEYNYPKFGAPRNIHSCRNNQHYDSRTANNQTFDTFPSGRQQGCQYLKSEMEEASTVNTYCRPNHGQNHARENENRYRSSSLLRKANDLIDYAPESQFLKKIKQQCRFLHNRQPNIFSTLNEFIKSEAPVYECQKCTDNSDPVSLPEETINSDRNNCPTEKSWKCNCNHASDVMDLNDDRAFTRNFGNGERRCREDKTEEDDVMETKKILKKKSEHVSRSKKPVKCRGRRKRKSDDSSEKCESEDQFEPTLKKPHENSCERCWRFASPSRSPVNKPDQKYDPNYRRGHSHMDLRKGSGDLVEKDSDFEKGPSYIEKEKARSLSPETLQIRSSGLPQVTKDKFPLCPVQSPLYSTKVKEFLNPACAYQKSLEKYVSSSLPRSDSQKPKTGGLECQNMLYSELGRKPRPKSYSPGLTPLETGKCSNLNKDFTATDYKSICMKPKKQCFDTFDSMNQIKTPPNLMQSSYRETCALRGCNPVGPCDQYNQKSVSELPTKKDKCDGSKLSSSKASKNLGDLDNRTLKTDSIVQGEPSLEKNPRSNSLPRKTTESVASDPSKLKTSQKSDAAKSKDTKSEKRTDKKTDKKNEKKPEKKTQKKTPQPPKAKSNSDKNRSTDNRDKVCGSDKEKSQSAGDSLMKEYHFNLAPNCGSTANHNKNAHPIKDCSCYPRIPRSKNNSENQNGHIFCCHCDWEENQNNRGASPCKTSAPARQTCGDNERYYRPTNNESNDRRFMNNAREYSHTQSTCLESNFNQSPRVEGTTISCPYREYYNSRSSNTPENSRYQTWENERRTSRDYRYVPGNQNFYPECSPRKYFMFYMTKSDECKKGDDVEVLVEELARPCQSGKDGRTKDIAEKMKKIMECPLDSMALRFQKGISEVYKTPPRSRVLYF